MYKERLASGAWGVFLDNGQRVGVHTTEKAAIRHLKKLRKQQGKE